MSPLSPEMVESFEESLRDAHRNGLMSNLEISVLLCANNEEAFIGRTLESLRRQDLKSGYEVIVIDNCSTDLTSEIALQFTSKVVRCDLRGKIPSLRAGIKLANGRIVALADADTIYPENWLSTICLAFDRHSGCTMVFGGTYVESNSSFLTSVSCALTDVFILISLRLGVACSIGFNITLSRDALVNILQDLRPYAFTGWAIGTACLKQHGAPCVVYLRKLRVPKCMRRYQASGHLRTATMWIREWWCLVRGRTMTLMESEYFGFEVTEMDE